MPLSCLRPSAKEVGRAAEGVGEVALADVHYGRREAILERRKEIKVRTSESRRGYYRPRQRRERPPTVHWRMAERAPIALETRGRVLGQYWSSITTGQ